MASNAPPTPYKPEALRPDTESATESTAADANKVLEGLAGMVATAPLAAYELAASDLPSLGGAKANTSEVGAQAGKAAEKVQQTTSGTPQSQQASTESVATQTNSQSLKHESALSSKSSAPQFHQLSPTEAHVENLAEGLAGMAITAPVVGLQKASHHLAAAGTTVAEQASRLSPQLPAVGQAVSQKAREAATSVGQQAAGAGQAVNSKAGETGEKASDLASQAASGAGAKAGQAGETPKGYVEQVVETVQGYLPAMLGGRVQESSDKSYTQAAVDSVKEKTPASLQPEFIMSVTRENLPTNLQPESLKSSAQETTPSSLQSGTDKPKSQIASDTANKMSYSIAETNPSKPSSSSTESTSTHSKAFAPSGSVAQTAQSSLGPAEPFMKSEKIPAYAGTGAGTTEASRKPASSEIPVYSAHVGAHEKPATITTAAEPWTDAHSEEALRQRAAAALSNAAFQTPPQ